MYIAHTHTHTQTHTHTHNEKKTTSSFLLPSLPLQHLSIPLSLSSTLPPESIPQTSLSLPPLSLPLFLFSLLPHLRRQTHHAADQEEEDL